MNFLKYYNKLNECNDILLNNNKEEFKKIKELLEKINKIIDITNKNVMFLNEHTKEKIIDFVDTYYLKIIYENKFNYVNKTKERFFSVNRISSFIFGIALIVCGIIYGIFANKGFLSTDDLIQLNNIKIALIIFGSFEATSWILMLGGYIYFGNEINYHKLLE